MVKSPFYKRLLSRKEEERFILLKKLYYSCYLMNYDWRVVNKKNNQTLMDIACMTNRCKEVVKYYEDKSEFLKKQREQKKKIQKLF